MPFLLAEILNFQGSTHHIGVGSFSELVYIASVFQTGRNTLWNILIKSTSTYLHPREMLLITSRNLKEE